MAQTTLRDRIQTIEDAISAGQIDDAMAHCQQILAHYPDALEIQRLLGEVYLAQGRLEEAQQTFDWILVNDPENVIAYCDRALICEHLSDIDTALDCYQQAYELSRGNSQIRREFNQLSARAGQQEFMMSRAGLARLYMRGDLLTQAVQEWEAVLASAPDRVDARLGLLETYWREGMYDQAEQIASRILEEIPNCVKALLLLAHITSAFNLQRSRELVQRAEILDPELSMAQELFNDLAASQPNDPFLPLVRKEPVVLEEQTNGYKKPIETINTLQYAAIEVNGSQPSDEEVSADRLYSWNTVDNLSELDTRTMQQAGSPSAPKATWSDDTNIEQVETWATGNPAGQNQPVDDFETWATQQEIDDDFDPALLEQQPWFQAEQATTLAAGPVEQVQADANANPLKEPDPASAPPSKEEIPELPAWLDMLTKTERRQPSGAMPTLREQSSHVEQPQEPAITAQSQAEPVPSSRQSWQDEFRTVPASPEEAEAVSPFFFAADEQDEDMGWPEWLKSLGAETIEPAAKTETQQSSPFSAWSDLQQSAQTPDPAQYESWTYQLQPSSMTTQKLEPPNASSWEEQIDQTMSEADRRQLATLETLEQSLLSQGFVPLQPGTLSTIAQESPLASVPEPSSSTLAENPVELSQPVPPVAEPLPEEAQPLASSDAYIRPQTTTPEEVAPEISAPPVVEPVTTPAVSLPQEEPVLATNRVEPAINAVARQDAMPIPAYRSDAFLESELETTMKRPAVRLQPMHTSATKTDHPYVVGRGRSAGGKSPESNLSNKERLLKGYQYQLAGAYDEAMQEYRILIRNAPELIGDLISNVRALLKLAPKYTAGYRVLGDAYMRQGEYLQAMEAYNKALTMAKKAKGLSH